jgi:hypothetical protein
MVLSAMSTGLSVIDEITPIPTINNTITVKENIIKATRVAKTFFRNIYKGLILKS